MEDKDTSGMPPIIHALNNSRILTTCYLLFEKRVFSDIVDANNCTIAHWAAYQKNINIIRIIDHLSYFDRYLDEKDS